MVQEWEKLDEEVVYDGFRKVLKRKYKLPNGKIAEYDIKKEGSAACVLALTDDNRIILAKQFRPGPQKLLLELPGGAGDKEESPDSIVRRELLEETGYTGDFQYLGPSWNCGYSDRLTHNFVATNCRKVQEQHLDEGEFIDVVLMSLEEFKTLLRSGELTDAKTAFLALDYLKLL